MTAPENYGVPIRGRNRFAGGYLSKEHRKNISKALKGRKLSEEHKRKIAISRIGFKHSAESKRKISKKCRDSKNSMWRGDSVGYSSLHKWVSRKMPKPDSCSCCKSRPAMDLANISQKYRRDINDFEWLCRSCHMKKDGRINNLKQFKNE